MSLSNKLLYNPLAWLRDALMSAIILLVPGLCHAAEIHVAVASNFSSTMLSIVRQFESKTQHKVILSFGSTGKHFSQIKNGAPFDVFFAADAHRPELLEKEGVALPGSRFTYAIGKLVLWSPKAGYIDSQAGILQHGDFRYLAIANPKLAPYGKAAREILQARRLWKRLQRRMVRGENIAQTLQFIKSGNAELGFVAYSQVKRANQPIEGSIWEVPQRLYSPIRQQAVLLTENEAARALLSFVRSEEALKMIRESGYDTP